MDPSEADWYQEQYSKVSVTGRPGRAQDVLHTLMERGFGPGDFFEHVLEVGANRGEHLQYVRHGFSQYYLTDLRLPPTSADARVISAEADVEKLPFADSHFDRVISTCVFHHVNNPEVALQEARRVTKPGGLITILLPTDPGIAYRTVRSMTTVRVASRRGLGRQANLVHARAHHNHFWSLEKLMHAAFADDSVEERFWPLRVRSWNMNLLTIWNIRVAAD
jgi:ubiquinone/menaquinone biosynthesis C-methylase UbiE